VIFRTGSLRRVMISWPRGTSEIMEMIIAREVTGLRF
jgi:hypothetical protein